MRTIANAAANAVTTSERFSPGGHALRARARAVNYNLKKSDFGGTPAWLKASSAAPDGGLAHGGGAKGGVTSMKIPTAAANARGAGAGRFQGKASLTAAAKGKAPVVFSVHARAAGEENAAAVAPAPQRAPRARPHGLEFSRAALNNAAADAGRGGAASTSQEYSGRGVPLKRPSKPAAAGGKKRGRPPANANHNQHEVHWGSAPSPHRSYSSYGGGAGNNSPSRYASMLASGGYDSPPQPARVNNNARFVQQNNGGNNEVTAAAAVAASAAAAGVLRKVQVRELFGLFYVNWREREALLAVEGERTRRNGRRGGECARTNPIIHLLRCRFRKKSFNDLIPFLLSQPLHLSTHLPTQHNRTSTPRSSRSTSASRSAASKK